MSQHSKPQTYHQSMFSYVMDSVPYEQEMKNETLPFVTSFGKTVYNKSSLVDVESDLKGQNILKTRCDNNINTNLGK